MRMLAVLPLAAITFARLNPRSDPAADLAELARSFGPPDRPRQAQLPLVQRRAGGTYEVIDGARRLHAAAVAGLTHVEVLVEDDPDPIAAQTLRLVANLHRRALPPLDCAAGLLLSYLVAQAEALDLRPAAVQILDSAASPLAAVAALQDALAAVDWNPIRPPVKWATHLDDLGLAMDPSRRKQLLRLLKLDPTVMARVQGLALSEPSLRAIAGLPTPADQHTFVDALIADPALERHARHISRMLKLGIYPTLADALAGVRGEVAGVPPSPVGLAVDRGDEADWPAAGLRDAVEEEPAEAPAARHTLRPGSEPPDVPAAPLRDRTVANEPLAGAPGSPAGSSGPPTGSDPAVLAAVAQALALAPQLETVLDTLQATTATAALADQRWGSYLIQALRPLRTRLAQLLE